MVFTIARDAHAVVIVTLWAPLEADDRPVLDRAVRHELRRPTRRIVIDFGPTEVGPQAVAEALRVAQECRAHSVPCAFVAEDREPLASALAQHTRPGPTRPVLATSLARALGAPPPSL